MLWRWHFRRSKKTSRIHPYMPEPYHICVLDKSCVRNGSVNNALWKCNESKWCNSISDCCSTHRRRLLHLHRQSPTVTQAAYWNIQILTSTIWTLHQKKMRKIWACMCACSFVLIGWEIRRQYIYSSIFYIFFFLQRRWNFRCMVSFSRSHSQHIISSW